MVTLNIRVHDALVVCRCGVQGSFSGDIGNLENKNCYLCQAVGQFVGTILQGYFTNHVFWDYRDRMAFAWFEFLYCAQMESLKRSRIARADDLGEKIRLDESDVRNRQQLMNAVSTVLKAELESKGETVEAQELCLDLARAAEYLANSTLRPIKRKSHLRYIELNEVLFDADAVRWLDPVEQSWKTGTLAAIRKSLASVVASDRNHVRLDLPLICIALADSDG